VPELHTAARTERKPIDVCSLIAGRKWISRARLLRYRFTDCQTWRQGAPRPHTDQEMPAKR
jgi:hypothetical protein